MHDGKLGFLLILEDLFISIVGLLCSSMKDNKKTLYLSIDVGYIDGTTYMVIFHNFTFSRLSFIYILLSIFHPNHTSPKPKLFND